MTKEPHVRECENGATVPYFDSLFGRSTKLLFVQVDVQPRVYREPPTAVCPLRRMLCFVDKLSIGDQTCAGDLVCQRTLGLAHIYAYPLETAIPSARGPICLCEHGRRKDVCAFPHPSVGLLSYSLLSALAKTRGRGRQQFRSGGRKKLTRII